MRVNNQSLLSAETKINGPCTVYYLTQVIFFPDKNFLNKPFQ